MVYIKWVNTMMTNGNQIFGHGYTAVYIMLYTQNVENVIN